MFDESNPNGTTHRIERTAEETADYLRQVYSDDPERMALLVGRIMSPAIMTFNPDQMLFWSVVVSHVRGEPLSDATLRELEIVSKKHTPPPQ